MSLCSLWFNALSLSSSCSFNFARTEKSSSVVVSPLTFVAGREFFQQPPHDFFRDLVLGRESVKLDLVRAGEGADLFGDGVA